MTILLESGESFTITYSWTFGEMAITAALLVLCVLQAMRWMYDVILFVYGRKQ